MVKLITHKKTFRFDGVDTFSILGKPLDQIRTKIPFTEPSVTISEISADDIQLDLFAPDEFPDEIHEFTSPNGDLSSFYFKNRVLLRQTYQSKPPQPSLISRFVQGLLRTRFSVPPKPKEEMPSINECGSIGSYIVRLNNHDLFEFATDNGHSISCDWRESPDAVVEYANKFLPAELRIQIVEDDDTITLANRNGRFTSEISICNAVDEPIPLLVSEINKLIDPTHAVRYFNCVDGTDGYSYYLQTMEFWHDFDVRFAADSRRIFREP